jgi:colanic acid/amylovoran biosynthesis glycosyltransferase
MKRIAFVINEFPPITSAFVTNQILNAHHAGHEIGIFPRSLNETDDVCQPEIVNQYNLMDKVIKPIPFELNKCTRIIWLLKTLYRGPRKLMFYFIKSLNPYIFGKNGINLLVLHRAVQFNSNPDFDIFHCQYGNNGLIAAWLKELGLIKGRIITTFHGYDAHSDDPNFKRIYSNLNTRIWATLIFRHSDLITVNTPYLLEQLLHLGADPKRIELLPMGVDTSFFFPKKNHYKKQNLQLLSVGRLVKWKTYDLGIQAVGELVKAGINLKYYIIGDGSELDNLQRLIEKLNLKVHVKLLGAKTQPEIKNRLQESDVFLMTSTFDNSGRRETQGLVTAEAQACGLPVVAFRSGGIPYTIEEGKTGYLAEEKNVSEFTQHLRKLCTDETLRKEMGQNARQFIVDNFCLSKLSQKQISLYEKVLLK